RVCGPTGTLNVLPSSAFRSSEVAATDWTTPWSFTWAPRFLAAFDGFVCVVAGLPEGEVDGRAAAAGGDRRKGRPRGERCHGRAREALLRVAHPDLIVPRDGYQRILRSQTWGKREGVTSVRVARASCRPGRAGCRRGRRLLRSRCRSLRRRPALGSAAGR